MKALFKLVLLLSLSYPAFVAAQTPVFSQSVDDPVEEFHFVNDNRSGTFCMLMKRKNTVDYLLLDSNLKLLSKVSSNGFTNSVYRYKEHGFREGFFNDNGFNFMFAVTDKSLLDGKTSHFRFETVDFKKGVVAEKFYLQIPKEEWTLQYFPWQEKNYLLTANDKTKDLVIYSVEKDGKTAKKNVSFDLKGFYKEKKLLLSEYLSYSKFFYPSQERDLRTATDLTKIFLYPGKFLMLCTNDKEPPHYFTIDTETGMMQKKKISMDGFCGYVKKAKFYTNSYLFDDKIFALNVCNGIIEIGVFDINGNLLKRHEISEDHPENFPDDAVQTKSAEMAHRKIKLDNIKKLANAMMKGSIGIAVTKNYAGNWILTCGTYDVNTVSVTRPSLNQPGFDRTSTSRRVYTSNFQVVMDPATYQILPDQPTRSRLDNVLEVLAGYSKNPGHKLFGVNDTFFVAYYDAGKKAMMINKPPIPALSKNDRN